MDDHDTPDMTSMQELPPMPEDACDQPGTGWLAGFGLTCAIVLAFALAYAFACLIAEACK